jgi:putative oxygen-independent coproporphyrinogen III oxidase
MALSTPPLALYLHFPWCVRKCPYCDFNSYTLRDELPEQRYVEALIADMRAQAPSVSGRPLVSVFMGGGTPSLFSPGAIARVLEAARACFGFTATLEVTLEANPGTIERGRFAEYRAAGVNRVSLGAQSFDAARLEVLGRIHSPLETCRAAEELHAAELSNFNLDLMYGLPGQDVAAALADIDQALALRPAHLSHYELTLEPGTVFAATPPQLPQEAQLADMQRACELRLGAQGFAQYEVSAYARGASFARHNLNYWTFGDYVGAGAGAHGKLSFASTGRIVRTWRPREPRRYLATLSTDAVEAGKAQPDVEQKLVATPDLPFEFMMNALRLTGGFERRLFEERTGLSWDAVATTIGELERKGLIESSAERCRPTASGTRFLNELLVRFLPDGPATRVSSALSTES